MRSCWYSKIRPMLTFRFLELDISFLEIFKKIPNKFASGWMGRVVITLCRKSYGHPLSPFVTLCQTTARLHLFSPQPHHRQPPPPPPPSSFHPTPCCLTSLLYDVVSFTVCLLAVCSWQHRLPGWTNTRSTWSMSCPRATPQGYSVCLNVPFWRTAWCQSCGSSTQNTWSVTIPGQLE